MGSMERSARLGSQREAKGVRRNASRSTVNVTYRVGWSTLEIRHPVRLPAPGSVGGECLFEPERQRSHVGEQEPHEHCSTVEQLLVVELSDPTLEPSHHCRARRSDRSRSGGMASDISRRRSSWLPNGGPTTFGWWARAHRRTRGSGPRSVASRKGCSGRPVCSSRRWPPGTTPLDRPRRVHGHSR